MPPNEKRTDLAGRVEMVGSTEEDRPDLVVHAVDDTGKVLATAKVGAGGEFKLPQAASAKAARVLIGPSDSDPVERAEDFVAYRVQDFSKLLGDPIRLPGDRWRPWLWATRCVSGRVRRCFPFPWLIDHLRETAIADVLGHVRLPVGPPIPHPLRCSPVCQGVIEVFRRTCCCEPIRLPDPPIDIEWPPRPIPIPDPSPFPPGPIPGPGPDPAPFEEIDRVMTGYALDQRKLDAFIDPARIRELGADALDWFIARRPYLWCHCGTPQKVADGFIADDGSFSICWRERFRFPRPHCRDEYAYRVTQVIGGTTVTIYDGVAAGQWFAQNAQPTLTSYSPFAVACPGRPPIPGASGAVVLLDMIGGTESWRLGTPDQDSPDSVLTPDPNSGLLDPAVTDGPDANRNLGGTLALRYFFSKGMQALGASYYRVMVAPADSAGNPSGSFVPVPAPAWRSWRWTGAQWLPGNHALGPVAVGAETGLNHIPFASGGLLAPDEQWADAQFHALLASTDRPDGRYLVRIEVFDGAGNRLRPTGSTGTGTQAPFIFGRWAQQLSPVNPVPFSALTHLFWWDNRNAVAQIEDFRINGSINTAVCQFLSGTGSDMFSVGYRAYHPHPGFPSFLRQHSLTVTKGLNGPTTTLVNGSFGEEGKPPSPAHQSPGVSLATLLAGSKRCSFSVQLSVLVKTTDGSSRQSQHDRYVTGAFALETP